MTVKRMTIVNCNEGFCVEAAGHRSKQAGTFEGAVRVVVEEARTGRLVSEPGTTRSYLVFQ